MSNSPQLAADQHLALVWVIVDGAVRHVSEFARLPAGSRPDARCPQCAGQLTLKLGRVRRHHAAHATSAQCATTHPETVLHINAKLAIAKQLRDAAGIGAVLRIVERCAGARDRCDKTRETAWLRDWDDVLVEYRVGDSRRPDIVLRRGRRDIGAVEVRATHAVPLEKETALSELGVPWVEVRAGGDLDIAETWAVSAALPVIRTSDTTAWRCDEHDAEHRAMRRVIAVERAERDEASRHSAVLRAARVVDLYQPGGSRTRFIYRIEEQLTDGQVHTAVLRCGRLSVATAKLASREDWPSHAWPTLRAAFAVELEKRCGAPGSFADSPMRWARAEAAQNIVEEALTDIVGRDPTPLASRYPRRWFFARDRGEWFLPREMRDVRWDRDANDIFAAHPAWTQARMAVRERAAPPGSWDTPVFAARPLATAFVDRAASAIHGIRHVGHVAVLDVRTQSGLGFRTLLIIERAPDNESTREADAFRDSSDDHIWITHPSDRSRVPADATWVAGGRDARGATVVSIDGIGVFRADQFVRAIATNDSRVSSAAINRQMADRVARLRGTRDLASH